MNLWKPFSEARLIDLKSMREVLHIPSSVQSWDSVNNQLSNNQSGLLRATIRLLISRKLSTLGCLRF